MRVGHQPVHQAEVEVDGAVDVAGEHGELGGAAVPWHAPQDLDALVVVLEPLPLRQGARRPVPDPVDVPRQTRPRQRRVQHARLRLRRPQHDALQERGVERYTHGLDRHVGEQVQFDEFVGAQVRDEAVWPSAGQDEGGAAGGLLLLLLLLFRLPLLLLFLFRLTTSLGGFRLGILGSGQEIAGPACSGAVLARGLLFVAFSVSFSV